MKERGSEFVDLFERPIAVRARAKLNLRLKIEGRRADGYHLLSMLNSTISLGDQLLIQVRERPGVQVDVEGCSDPALREVLQDPARNIAALAVQRLFDAFGLSFGFSLTILKRIPAGAGMGGGSSDAAVLLNALVGALAPSLVGSGACTFEQLKSQAFRIGLGLGADVPYLMVGGFAWVGKIGEEIEPLPADTMGGVPCVLVCPRVHLSTKGVFLAFARRKEVMKQDAPAREFVASAQLLANRERYGRVVDLIENDLLESACGESPLVDEVMHLLATLPRVRFGMTGSGSTFFILPPSFGEDLIGVEEELRGLLKGLDVQVLPVVLDPRATGDQGGSV